MPLYTGGEITTRREQARLGVEAAGRDRASAGDRAALQAAEAFVRLTQAREQVALLTKARETLAAHVELARAYAGQGMLVRSELLRAEVELARLDDLLAEARGQARVAEKGLSFRLGRSLDTRWDLAPLGEAPELAEELAAWQASAAGRPDVAAARARLAAASEAVRITEELFRAGVAKTLDVLDAATARRETQPRELVARTEAHLAALRLALAAGRAPESMLKQQPEGGKP